MCRGRIRIAIYYTLDHFVILHELMHLHPSSITPGTEKPQQAEAGLLRRAGLVHIRLHDCRQTACALLLSQGIQIHVVSKILGHANPSITLKVYSKALPAQQDEAALAIDNLLFG